MAMRLKGKPPHPDWPVQYPYESPERDSYPVRAINDVENYLISILTQGPPTFSQTEGPEIRPTYDTPYMERHVYEYEPEIEDDVSRVYPAVWVPPQVFGRRSWKIFEN